MKNKRVWLISHYSMPPEYEMRIKTEMYAHYLGQLGYDVTIFSASTIHNTDINLITDNSPYVERTYGDLKFVHIKCSNYSGNGLKRIINMQQFAYRFRRVAKNFPQPDVVVADVNCTTYKQIYLFCKKLNIPFYIDMRDLWPSSIVEYLGYSEDNPIIKYLYHREKVMYSKATGIIFSMEGGKDYIKDKHWENIDLSKLYYINNGVDLEKFYWEMNNYVVKDPDLDNSSLFKVVYTGSVRIANNLKSLVKAAELLEDPNIKIIIYGDGDERPKLEQYCAEKKLSNIVFKGQVEKKYIPSILSKGDLSVLNYKKAKTLKYGGSQNKLFEYLAAGHPVLLTVDMNYNIVTSNDCGAALDDPNPKEIAKAIEHFASMPKNKLEDMGKRAKEVAREYDFKVLTNKLLKIIDPDAFIRKQS